MSQCIITLSSLCTSTVHDYTAETVTPIIPPSMAFHVCMNFLQFQLQHGSSHCFFGDSVMMHSLNDAWSSFIFSLVLANLWKWWMEAGGWRVKIMRPPSQGELPSPPLTSSIAEHELRDLLLLSLTMASQWVSLLSSLVYSRKQSQCGHMAGWNLRTMGTKSSVINSAASVNCSYDFPQ